MDSVVVQEWWSTLNATGRPDYIFAWNLMPIKGKLKEWDQNNHGDLEKEKNDILVQINTLDDMNFEEFAKGGNNMVTKIKGIVAQKMRQEHKALSENSQCT